MDTTFAWASSEPTGLLQDAFNVRLIPHYSLAIQFAISHIAVGLRAVLLNHRFSVAVANGAAWMGCAVAFLTALIVTLAQLRVGT